MPELPLTVFYDGACRVCSAEIDVYRRRQGPERLRFVDISDPGFDGASYGLSNEAVAAEMHVVDGAGGIHRGVAAFTAIWKVMPGLFYPALARGLELPGVNALARLGYRIFARYRYLLPRRARECSDDACTLGHRKK